MSTLKKLAKKAARGALKAATGVVRATPAGAAAGALFSAVRGGSSRGPQGFNQPGIQLPGGVSIDLPGFGRPGFGILPTGGKGRVQPGPNGECPKGYHLNRTKSADGLAPKSFCVRNRHVNYANGRAARRAGRRLKGTVRVLRKSFTLVAAKAPKGKWIPKGGRKR